jgi:hypothetical protein
MKGRLYTVGALDSPVVQPSRSGGAVCLCISINTPAPQLSRTAE